MLISGILNPHLNHLLSRIRHTNTVVIADRGFPYWPQIETVDLSLVDDVPTVLQVLQAIRSNGKFGGALMAQEFLDNNDQPTKDAFAKGLEGVPTSYMHHDTFKTHVPKAIGLVRTGDTVQYANMILESA